MYCVLWTYDAPQELTEERIRDQFDGVAGSYVDIPGPVRKYFGFTDDATEVIGIYL